MLDANRRNILIVCCICILLSIKTSVLYYNYYTTYFDFGIFLHNLTNIRSNPFLQFDGHVQLLGYIYGFIYTILPDVVKPYALIALNKIPIGIFLYQISRYFGTKYIFYALLYIPLWYLAVDEFHYDVIAVPLIFQGILYVNSDKKLKLLAVAISLILTKEIFGVTLVSLGLYYTIFHRRVGSISVFLVSLGFFWTYLTTQVLVPTVSGEAFNLVNSSVFSWLFSGIDINDIVDVLLVREKFIYLTVIFGSVLILAIFDVRSFVFTVPVILVSLAAKGMPLYYSYTNHYTAAIIGPILYFTFSVATSTSNHVIVKFLSRRLLLSLVVFHITFSNSPFSRFFWNDKVWGFSYRAYDLSKSDRRVALDEAIMTYVPKGREVSVTTSNTINSFYLANRTHYFTFPEGVIYPHRKKMEFGRNNLKYVEHYSDFLVLELNGPKFNMEKGCEYIYHRCQDGNFLKAYDLLLSETFQRYVPVFRNDFVMILKRKAVR